MALDTHGGEGWLLNVTGTNNNISGTLAGTAWRRLPNWGGTRQGALAAYYRKVTASGLEQIKVNTTSGSSALDWVVMSISGVQPILDPSTFANFQGSGSASYTMSPTFPSVVPNELLGIVADTGHASPDDSISFAAPFSLTVPPFTFLGTDTMAAGSAVISAAGTTTGTTNVTSGISTSAPASTLMFGLRPALSANGCPTNFGTFEKIRRQVY